MFKDRLQQLRAAKGLKLEQLANRVGSTKSYIWELENKEAIRPSADLVNRLAKELESTVEYLMGAEASDNDQVFFREYKDLKPETKKQLHGILKALKDSNQ